jgi:lipopolysaccharide export system permease protein
MKKIDQYIIGKFLVSFFYTAMLFTLISLVIDFAEKAERLLNEDVSWYRILTEYYLNFIPYINGLLWPLFTLIAVIFFTSRLARDSEFIAMLNAGVSFRRLLFPYLLTSTFIAILFFIGGHYVIPEANKVKFNFENTFIFKSNDKGKTRDVHLMVGDQTKVFVRYYRKIDTSARDVRIETFSDGQVKKVIEVEEMIWADSPNVWKLKNFMTHKFNDSTELLINGMDSSRLINLNLFPKDFVQFVNDKEYMTSPELMHYIRTERAKGRSNLSQYEVEYHRRTAESFTIIILTIIGMVVASRKVRGGLGLHLALGISLGAIFIFLSRFSVTFAANQNINPAFGVWIPNLIFILVAAYLFTKAQR